MRRGQEDPRPGTGRGSEEGLRGCVQWERVGGEGALLQHRGREHSDQGRGSSPGSHPASPLPSHVTVRYQPPHVVSLNGRFWRWPGRCHSPEPLDSQRPFPEPRGRPQGLSYSPGLHCSPRNKGLRPGWCINKGALSGKHGSKRRGGGRGEAEAGERGAAAMQAPFFLKSAQGSSSWRRKDRGEAPHRAMAAREPTRTRTGPCPGWDDLPRGGKGARDNGQARALSTLR